MKFFYKIELPRTNSWAFNQSAEALEIKEWCRMSLGKPVRGGNWWTNRNHIYFKDEKCYMAYALRWSK
jgi:hypothetical protein